ncbi:hypothetical protein [Pseudomonas syringae]|uniref:Uncharacterized protein n=1 Tax=Pseudomonas syringae TaxID=317 RepID=A0A085UKY4_PSESX|nr:hypothetical protein [Pseudomonas syringae]KFE43847.1 hypothetical protein IV02_30800 [Pseudomonas syringae]
MGKHRGYERCMALSGSRVLGERQIGWSGRWCLMGDFVVCTQCLAAQAIDQAHEPFVHVPDCVARQFGLHPWHELQHILGQLPPQNPEHRP